MLLLLVYGAGDGLRGCVGGAARRTAWDGTLLPFARLTGLFVPPHIEGRNIGRDEGSVIKAGFEDWFFRRSSLLPQNSLAASYV